jgi:hypothetical protein
MSKNGFAFQASVNERTGQLEVAHFRFREGTFHHTREVIDGAAVIEEDRANRPLAFEVIAPRPVSVFEAVGREWFPDYVDFVLGMMPPAMIAPEPETARKAKRAPTRKPAHSVREKIMKIEGSIRKRTPDLGKGLRADVRDKLSAKPRKKGQAAEAEELAKEG